jgi:hypothetical protein
MARPSCVDCTRKHLSQAVILIDEAYNGYSVHRWLAMGHLAEAESEIRGFDLELSNRIRKARLELQDGNDPDILHFIVEITNRYAKNEFNSNAEAYKYWDDEKNEVNIGGNNNGKHK